MVEPVLYLLDPDNKIRRRDSALADVEIEAYETVHDFVLGLAEAQPPALAVAVLASEPEDPLAGLLRTANVLLLVVTTDARTGGEWLEAGASDFVVLPARRRELGARFRALLRCHQGLYELRKSERMATRLIGDLIHDIKNHLNAVFGYGQLILLDSRVDAETVRDDLMNVLKNAQGIQDICERVISDLPEEIVQESP